MNLDVNVVLDRDHQFVKGLKPDNFLVVEDGVEQQVQTVRVTKAPITAVLLLEFAAELLRFHPRHAERIGYILPLAAARRLRRGGDV